MTELGPVSASLEAELRKLARQHGIVCGSTTGLDLDEGGDGELGVELTA
jgi:hypothetical protein